MTEEEEIRHSYRSNSEIMKIYLSGEWDFKDFSTSEQLMIAFVYGNWSQFFPDHPLQDPYAAWKRMDDGQRMIVEEWRGKWVLEFPKKKKNSKGDNMQ